MTNDTATRVLMSISDNQGYSPEQIRHTATLGELLVHVQQAIDDFGADALVVLANGQRFGAGYGSINASAWSDLFTAAEDSDEE